jgi:hypothetical protein
MRLAVNRLLRARGCAKTRKQLALGTGPDEADRRERAR